MRTFGYETATSPEDAVRLVAANPGAKLLGGGTNLVDLMRAGIENPPMLIDLTRAGMTEIESRDGRLRIGGAVRNTDLAADETVRRRFPLISKAVVSGASGQLRNMATVGGNLMQRTRCSYFYDLETACNKRLPGSGCDARTGFHRMGAILGASENCLSVHPSDLCVALAAADAEVELTGPDGVRVVPINELYREPGDTPHVENVAQPGEVITAVEVPPLPAGVRSTYRKVRDRASYAFALVSVAAALTVEDGTISQARLALGGIGTVPWRARAAERILTAAPSTPDTFRAAIAAELEAAVGTADTEFKIGLTARTVVAVLSDLTREASR